jgi:hypothetical protein
VFRKVRRLFYKFPVLSCKKEWKGNKPSTLHPLSNHTPWEGPPPRHCAKRSQPRYFSSAHFALVAVLPFPPPQVPLLAPLALTPPQPLAFQKKPCSNQGTGITHVTSIRREVPLCLLPSPPSPPPPTLNLTHAKSLSPNFSTQSAFTSCVQQGKRVGS